MGKRIVHKIEPGMDRQTVHCTTYQMRNFYKQFRDGLPSSLEVMNYIQHHQITRWCKPGNHILDVCCGRGLMLPLLRYHAKQIGSYTGVDIKPGNATFTRQRVTDGKSINPKEYYPFPVSFVHSDVSEMSNHLTRKFDIIIYTSAIEHMHKNVGQASLVECRKVSKPGTILILTCPNTPETQDGYDTQYKAHVYEWKRSELSSGLKQAGFSIITEWGIHISKRDLKSEAERLGLLPLIERLEKFIPGEWLTPVLAPMFPKASKEIAFLAKAI